MRRRIAGALGWSLALATLALTVPAGWGQHPAAAYSVSEVYATTAPSAVRVPIAGSTRTARTVTGVVQRITVAPGDIVQVFATVQVTSPYAPAVMVGRYLELGSKTISRRFTTNVTGQIHHLPAPAMASVKVVTGGTFDIRQVLYAASSAARSGWALRIDYAELQVTVLRA